jgi:uncharacterized protein (DUF1697 family)
MAVHIALLRGINVGKAKRVPMADLKDLLKGLGYPDAATLLNSGNAVFRGAEAPADRLADRIAEALEARFGFPVEVVVVSAAALDAMVAENALAPGADAAHLLAIFGKADLGRIEALAKPPERFLRGRHGAYLQCAPTILESAAGKALLGVKGITTRNWATVLKLQALARG